MNYKEFELFSDLENSEIKEIIDSDYVREEKFLKDETIFNQGDMPEELFILLDGAVMVEKIDINGKRTIVNIFRERGTMFGEVYLYLDKRSYDYQCVTQKESLVMCISKNFFQDIYSIKKPYGQKIINNMLKILSGKAFYLNQKLLILASFTLKQKIANYLLQKSEESKEVDLDFNREELADYIGTTRPSLSRELMVMEADGLIRVKRNKIIILNKEELKDIS